MQFNMTAVQGLIDRGLLHRKMYTKGPYAGLSVLKYSRKVFYDHLWNADPLLMECRGTVIDEEGNVIVLPFRKIFNYGENNTFVDPDEMVIGAMKVNGFLGVMTIREEGDIIYSTTGSLDSDYVSLIKKNIGLTESQKDLLLPGISYMFEICDPSDPHIVPEQSGAHFIGAREVGSGVLYHEQLLDLVAAATGWKRPYAFKAPMGYFLSASKNMPQEGWVIRKSGYDQIPLLKLKSVQYLNKKALMRVGKTKADAMFNNPDRFREKLDEEFYRLFDEIISTYEKEDWLSMDEQERRAFIEGNL